ncbi:uncharacterized protein LOC134206642 [Armigeres subalbatus]|uniref:uncharacterized protein LOC134206642 n=1 Tax=Armigeres subalbatus TaxID=124917 RepID=UPI002ED68C24
MCNVALLQELTEKLPPPIRLNWAYHRQNLNRATLSEFGDWLEKLVEAASIVTMPSISALKLEKRGKKDENFINVHTESDVDIGAPVRNHMATTPRVCLVCLGQCGSIEKCPKFLELNVSSRWSKGAEVMQKVYTKAFWSLSNEIVLWEEWLSIHVNSLLHDSNRYSKSTNEVSTSSTNENPTIQSCNTHLKATTRVLFRYVPVTIYGKGKQVKTYAFLNDGLSATLIEHSLLKELGLKGTPYPLCLDWTGGQQREENESVVLSLKISGTNEASEVFELPEVHSVRDLSLPEQSMSISKMKARYNHLEGLPLESYGSVSPKIMIGMNNCRLGHALKSVEGGENEPVVSKTRLGWIVYGPCAIASGTTYSGYSGHHSFHICPCAKEEAIDLDAAFKKYFSIESLGISGSTKTLLSKDEERAIEILSSETRLIGNRYETGLLWRFAQVQLPDNREMALKRFACLQKRLKREPNLATAMRAKMSEYEEKGYIRRLSATEKAEKHPKDWYLPIFPVTNPNKPGKLRIVFDAAAKVNGVSLNSLLLTGPDQLVSLLTVLYKFREFRIAVVGDIREMFFQVRMKEQDQRSPMILWNNERPEDEPEVYVVRVMTFGAACSPSCAHYVKNRNADRFSDQYPRAVEYVKYEHYVGDMLASVETEEEAVKLASEVRTIHSQHT